MTIRSVLFTAAILVTQINAAHAASVFNPFVVYGADNRVEYYQAAPELQKLANSTVALVEDQKITTRGTNFHVESENFGEAYGLCTSEPFRDEPIAPHCSGFLIGKDLIATAGHCVESQMNCESTRFLFDYKLTARGQVPGDLVKNNVYSCKKLVSRIQAPGDGRDYAIVQLDRPVVGREPLKMRTSGQLKVGDSLVVMGHPNGLPLKIAGGAKVRRIETDFFVANLDTYGGNSGSAVFNLATGLVEGILVRGEDDFVSRGGCAITKACSDNSCRGEDVTWISDVIANMPR